MYAMKKNKPAHVDCRNIRFCLIAAIFLLTLLPAAGVSAESAVIQIRYRRVSEVLPLAGHFLSSSGIVSADERTNALIVVDTADAIAKIEAFLQTFDVPLKRVRIRLRINESQSGEERAASVTANLSKDRGRIASGEDHKQGIDVRLKDSQNKARQAHEYWIQTTSGSKAYILTGREIPYRQNWNVFCRRYGGCSDITFQRIDTGMEIKPVIVGDQAHIEITPRISQIDSSDPRGIVRFAGAATTVTVPLGQWVTIGGADSKSNEVLSEILSGADQDRSRSLSMSLLVETY